MITPPSMSSFSLALARHIALKMTPRPSVLLRPVDTGQSCGVGEDARGLGGAPAAESLGPALDPLKRGHRRPQGSEKAVR